MCNRLNIVLEDTTAPGTKDKMSNTMPFKSIKHASSSFPHHAFDLRCFTFRIQSAHHGLSYNAGIDSWRSENIRNNGTLP